ncbi:hypothetical protein ABEF93_006404 [Exophiala dermatitidis]
MAEANRPDRTAASAGQSCRECRRRKGKCDGKMPVCSICQRYNRHCLYDKHSRSSLTRKHLTEVEERLEKAEALLRTVFTEAELAEMLAHGASAGTNHAFRGTSATQSASQGATQTINEPVSFFRQTEQKTDSSFLQPGAVGASANDAQGTSLSFESLPAAEDDFEWDEREPSWAMPDPGGESSVPETDAEADIPRITDGMATLTADDSNTGFWGSVSGAALLRLIWMGNAIEAGDERPELRRERRKSLEQLFKKSPEQYASSLSWLQTQPLITRAVVDNLVDAYFAFYHPTFPILHEPTFREQYAKLNGRPGGSTSTWHILANLVAALGSFVSTTCSDDTHITLFNGVKGNLTIGSLETGSLNLVQAFALAANYLQKRNRPNSGYNYGGIALRMAISLGLHKEFHGWRTAPFKKEIRRRVWWSLCVLDVGATVTYGRPLNWPQVGVETVFPLNIHERDLSPSSTTVPPEVNEATIYTYIRTQSSYHLRTIPIYNRLISNPVPSAGELISLDDELVQGWLTGLPAYYSDQDLPLPQGFLLGHAIGRWRFRLLRIIMYRPFLIRWAQNGLIGSVKSLGTSSSGPGSAPPAESVATMRCFQAAEECISCIYQFWAAGTHTRLAAWYVLYFLLQAALIPIHCLRRNPSHPDAESWRTQVQTSLDIINSMININLNPSAPKCRDIIYRLCGSSLGPHGAAAQASHMQTQTHPHSQPPQSSRLHPHPEVNVKTEDDITANSNSNMDSSWPTLFPTAGFAANPSFSYSASGTGPGAAADGSGGGEGDLMDPWMAEVDTAIDNYDIYCDRLSNAAMAGMGLAPQYNSSSNSGYTYGAPGGGSGSGGGVVDGSGSLDTSIADGTEIGTGVQDWDWGLIL